METVAECAGHLSELIDALVAGDTMRVSHISQQIDQLESEADNRKHAYRLIDYVGRIANRAENVGDRVLLLIAK